VGGVEIRHKVGGRAAEGTLADHTSIDFVYRVSAFLPAIGLLAVFLRAISPSEARTGR
jgi:FSR family fosmidomycin resistance protein-like MFS transporter